MSNHLSLRITEYNTPKEYAFMNSHNLSLNLMLTWIYLSRLMFAGHCKSNYQSDANSAPYGTDVCFVRSWWRLFDTFLVNFFRFFIFENGITNFWQNNFGKILETNFLIYYYLLLTLRLQNYFSYITNTGHITTTA